MTNQPIKRTSYLDGQGNPHGGAAARSESQVDITSYHQLLEQVHGSSLHTWGIASGLGVTVTSGTPTIVVTPGVGLDAVGRHISLAINGWAETNPGAIANQPQTSTLVQVNSNGVTLTTTASISGGSTYNGDWYLTIEWRETFDINTWNASQGQTYQTLHTPWLRLQPATAFADPKQNNGLQLILGKVTLDASGNVTNLSSDYRRYAGIAAGNLQIQKPSTTTIPNSTRAGGIQPLASGGLDLTVVNASDEIHLESEDSSNANFKKLSIGAETVATRRSAGTDSVTIDTETGNIKTDGTITATGNISTNGAINISTNGTIDATGNISTNGTITAAGSISTNGTVVAGTANSNGEVIVKDTHNASTIGLDGGLATISAGTIGHYGIIQVLNASGQVVCTLDGQQGNATFYGDAKLVGKVTIGGDLTFNGNLIGQSGNATKAHVLPMFAQNTTLVQSVSLSAKQQVFAFIALTSLNILTAQSNTAGFATISSVDGQPTGSGGSGNPLNNTWSGQAQTITFSLVARSSQAWALGVVFPISS